MPLQAVQAGLENDIAESVRAYEELATTRTFARSSEFTHEDVCMLEGIVSHVWQAWCQFCRTLIIESCVGTVDVSGNVILGRPEALSEQHVSGAAVRIKRGRTPTWGAPNNVLRLEPTWGDVDVLTDIVRATNPANATRISGMCTLASPSAKTLQLVRNAAAHRNPQTMAELHRLGSAYVAFPITHPSQALFWTEGTSGNYLLPEVVDDLVTASMYVVV
jgi:hypothetical protein